MSAHGAVITKSIRLWEQALEARQAAERAHRESGDMLQALSDVYELLDPVANDREFHACVILERALGLNRSEPKQGALDVG